MENDTADGAGDFFNNSRELTNRWVVDDKVWVLSPFKHFTSKQKLIYKNNQLAGRFKFKVTAIFECR